MRILILLTVAISVAFANAERKSNFTKPIVNLDKRPRPPVWNRPPEDRRKLSIFPKANMKFVVTHKPVQNNNTPKEGLSTKRPLMRKFLMQDKNERGTWSFAPREPLMKTKRYTVTLAPPKLNKEIVEPKPEESKKVNTVISNLNKEQKSSKVQNLNNGNLIATIQNRKVNNSASKPIQKFEHKHVGGVNSGLRKANEKMDFDLIQINNNKMNMPNKNSEDYAIDVRRLNDEDVISKEYRRNNENNAYKSVPLVEMPFNLNKKEDFKDVESKTVDLSEIEYPLDQNVNNSLNNSGDSDNHKTGQVLAISDLEILLEKIVNQTEEFNVNSAVNNNDSDAKDMVNGQTNDTFEDISQFDVTKPNTFYEVISLSNHQDENKELDEKTSIAGHIVPDSLNMDNVEIAAVSDTNDLNEAKYLTESTVRSLVVGNLEKLLNVIEEKKDKLTMDKVKLSRDIVDKLTGKPITKGPNRDRIVNETKDKLQAEELSKFDKNSSTNLNSEEILLEVYESNGDLSSEEISAESLNDKDSNEISKESVTDSPNLTLEDISNEARETSDESINDSLNNHTEELSNEPLIDVSNDLIGETISNESSSNIATEELSNESIIETFNNFTDEERFDVSSSNMSSEVLSNKSNTVQSINPTEEASNEFIIESSKNLTGENISNESTSNMAGEEFSNESNNFTGEDVSDEWLVDQSEGVVEELIADESVVSLQDPSAEEISDEALTNRFKRSDNIIEEEYLATTVSASKYTGHVETLNHDDSSYKNINS